MRCRDTTQKRHKDPTATLVCSACKEELPERCFPKDSLVEWRRTETLTMAKCLKCQPSRGESRLYPCNKCGRQLELGCFPPQMQRQHSLCKWRCDACQRPTCTICGERPSSALTHHVEDVASYRCQSCEYPACEVCGKPRTAKQKRKAENVDAKPTWRCKNCRA